MVSTNHTRERDAASARIKGLEVELAEVGRARERRGGAPALPPPPPRTKWTRRVPHPVLIGHAASLTRL